MNIKEAAMVAANLRFRAVIMTALSFILGVSPLLFATGAGAASRVAVGYVSLVGWSRRHQSGFFYSGALCRIPIHARDAI